MKNFDEAYLKLNPAQKEAVDTVEGPVMVVAGPGTGKTTLLTLRIANILRTTDSAPENILALTFTNSGVHAMRKKLIEYIGDDAYRVGVYTFHSFAENIIKEFSFYFKHLEFSQVITDIQKVQILEDIISKGKYKEIVSKHDVFASLRQVRDAIVALKQEGLSPQKYIQKIPAWETEMLEDDSMLYKRAFGKYKAGDVKPAEKEKVTKKIEKAKEIADVFEKYQEVLDEQNLYDFSDMILNVLEEIVKNENLKLDLQEHYQYLLVDEHQDTNEGQNRLVKLLCDADHLGGRPNIFTVGDEKQSIYRFQGASDVTFTRFQELYTDIKTIFLENNYRSTQDILDASYSLIDHSISNTQRLSAFSSDKQKISYLEFSNYKFELLHLAQDIQQKIDAGIDPNNIAVIYRSNKHIEDVRTIFNHRNIPHIIRSNEYLFQDAHIQNLLTVLRAIHNPHNNYILARALFIDFLQRNIPDVLEMLDVHAQENRSGKRPLFVLLAEEKRFKDLVVTLTKLKSLEKNKDFGTFFKLFLEESGYMEYMLGLPGSRDHLIKIDKLFDEIKRQIQTKKNYSLTDFIAFIDAYESYGLDIATQEPEFKDGVQCMTAHKSKGLEFDYVYMVGSTRSSWEKSRGVPSITLPVKRYTGDIHDERRLFYVAMTRAKKELSILSSKTDWEGKEQDKSQFITEIDDVYIETKNTERFEKEHADNLSEFLKPTQVQDSLFDISYLSQKFIQTNLSVTSLNNYLSCPVKYLFRNLIQLPAEYSANLVYGDVVHHTLEKFFEDAREQKKIGTKKQLRNLFDETINRSQLFGDEHARYLERGKDALGEYYTEYAKGWSLRVENEKYIRQDFDLESGDVLTLSGRIDKVEFMDSEAEGKIRIIDYKTGKPFSDKARKSDKEDLKRQLVFYHLLYEKYADGVFVIDQAILDFVEKNKKGVFEQYTVAVEKSDLQELQENINDMAKSVISGEFLEQGCRKKDCEYCGLFERVRGKS